MKEQKIDELLEMLLPGQCAQIERYLWDNSKYYANKDNAERKDMEDMALYIHKYLVKFTDLYTGC